MSNGGLTEFRPDKNTEFKTMPPNDLISIFSGYVKKTEKALQSEFPDFSFRPEQVSYSSNSPGYMNRKHQYVGEYRKSKKCGIDVVLFFELSGQKLGVLHKFYPDSISAVRFMVSTPSPKPGCLSILLAILSVLVSYAGLSSTGLRPVASLIIAIAIGALLLLGLTYGFAALTRIGKNSAARKAHTTSKELATSAWELMQPIIVDFEHTCKLSQT